MKSYFKELGKWQLIMTIIALVVFFIVLNLIGANIAANKYFWPIIFLILLVLYVFLFAAPYEGEMTSRNRTIIGIFLTIFMSMWAGIQVAIGTGSNPIIPSVVVVACVFMVVFATIILAGKDKIIIKDFLFPLVLQFIVILTPMLILMY